MGYSNGASVNNNYGFVPQNAAWAIASTGTGDKNNAVFAFAGQTGTVTSASVQNAYINLYAHGTLGSLNGHEGTTNECHLQQLKSTWAENTITWSNVPSVDTTNQVTLKKSTSANQDYLQIDVTNLVKNTLDNGTIDNGFLLSLVNDKIKNSMIFKSKDYNTSDT